jgi:hypothetical protein
MAQVTQTIRAAFASLSDPTSRRYVKLIDEFRPYNSWDQHRRVAFVKTYITPYLNACNTNPRSLVNSADDYYTLIRSRIVKAAKYPILEPQTLMMFPEVERIRSGELKNEARRVRVNENCELEQ